MRRTHYGLCLLLSLFTILCWLEAPAAMTLAVGEDITITEMDFHRTDVRNSCDELLGQYDVGSSGNSAYVSGSTTVNEYLPDGSSIGEGVQLSAQVGIDVNWDTGAYSWEQVRTWPVRITLNYSYEIEANNSGCCGHANVRLDDSFSAAGSWVDGVFSINQGRVYSSGTKTRSASMTLEDVPRLFVRLMSDACTRSMPPGHSPGPADSYGTLTVNSIKIEFLPQVVSISPDNWWSWVPVNTNITIQFSESMDRASVEGFFEMEDDHANKINGTFSWSQTASPDDTVSFVPDDTLRYGAHYSFWFTGWSTAGEGLDGTWREYGVSFITKHSYADATPPTVQFAYPYDGMTGVPTAGDIFFTLNEAVDLPSTINSSNIILGGPGISGPGDYGVWYDFGEGWVPIWTNSPLEPFQTYTVTITTDVKDARGNWLDNEYSWSFTTGGSDTTSPAVTQTIPASGDTNVTINSWIWACFSEAMDVGSFSDPGNITLFDNTSSVPVEFFIRRPNPNYVAISPLTDLQYGHTYTATITTGVRDRAGNSLDTAYSWSFTTASGGENGDPVIRAGLDDDEQVGIRESSGTRVWLELGASDSDTGDEPLNVTANGWILSFEDPQWGGYTYESPGDEGLSPGTHTLTLLVKDNASPPNEVTFEKDIYIFNSYPLLTSPSNGATAVSTRPTLQWDSNGINGAFMYEVTVLDGSDPDTATRVWEGYQAADGSTSYSTAIAADKALAPNTTYWWRVVGYRWGENGEARSDIWSFTTGGTDWPAPSFQWIVVRGDNRSTGQRIGIGAKVLGPSPADIREFTVSWDGGGYYYKFTEDDVSYDFMSGTSYWHWGQVPPNGTYTFSVEDKKGRTATASRDFTFNALPIVNSGITPADSAYVNTTTPTFSWDPVGTGYYYRIMIMSWNGPAVYTSARSTNTVVTVPSGVLLPNTPYKWRIEVHDGPTGGVVNNRSRTDWMRFSTGPYPYTIDVNFGIVWSDNNYYDGPGTSLSTQIVGPLPNDVVDLNVSGPGYYYEFTQGDIIYDRDDGAIYVHGEAGYPPDGTYDFYVEDADGASDTYSKGLTFSEIPIADRSTFSPENNAYLTTLTPTLSWAAVSGSPRYYQVTVEDWRRRVIIYESPRSTDTFATVPAGVLDLDATYMWRVDVFDDSSGLVANNSSSSGWYLFTIPSSLDTDNDGIADLVDTEPTVSSNDFSDGTTTGTITDRGDQVLFITDEPYPDGVRITASIGGGPIKAKVSACGGAARYKLAAGDEVVVTCTSVTTRVISGAVEITFVAADGTPAATVLEEGNSLSFEPATFTFTTPPTNPDVIVVLVEGEEFPVLPGESKTIVEIDIKPGSDPNGINLKDQGLLPVAILGSDSFDVNTINPESIEIGGVSLATRGSAKAPKLAYSYEDVNEDGYMDLMAFFEIQDLVDAEVLTETTTSLVLSAETNNGGQIEGMDSVNIVP